MLAWLALASLCAPTAARSYDPRDNGAVFDRAWALATRHYWNSKKLGPAWTAARAGDRARALSARDDHALYLAINASLDRLGDSHAYATSPSERALAKQEAREHSESGFGFDAVKTGDRWLIHAVDPQGPAAAAGMQIGWTLLMVDGAAVDVDRHFGEGESASLVLSDETGGRHVMTLTGVRLAAEPDRRIIRLPGGILAVALDQFTPGDERWLVRALRQAPAPVGVILDLRENDGGDAGVLDHVAGALMTRQRVILTLVARHEQDEMTAGAGPRSYSGPLAVLVGPRTASAAEALAAFLDEAGRACTVGETTAGELTGGVDHRLPDGGRLTIAEYDVRTPAGTRLEGRGFTPHYPARASLAQLRAGADPVMEKAVVLIRAGACPAGSGGGT